MNTLQTLPLSGGGQVTVTATQTRCGRLVVTPTVDSGGGLRGGLQLVHTLTGRSMAASSSRGALEKLADRLTGYNLEFTDPGFLSDPANQELRDALVAEFRAWEMSEAYEGPAHFSGEPAELAAAREREPASTLLREHLEWWLKHHEGFPRNFDHVAANREAYAANISVSVEGYGLIYLLAVLRSVDPAVADIAARSLVGAWDAGDSLGEWVWQWHRELVDGDALTLHGIPRHDPLCGFEAPAERPDDAVVG